LIYSQSITNQERTGRKNERMSATAVLQHGPRDGEEVTLEETGWNLPGSVAQSVCIEIVEPTAAYRRNGFVCWRLACTIEGVPMRDGEGRLVYRLDQTGVSWIDW
jgi:hypothetical protein